MKRSARILSVCIVLSGLLFVFNQIAAQTQVTATLYPPPPNQLRIADLWRIDLFNTTRQTLRIYLHGTVTEAKDGLVVDATTASFDLRPGRTALKGPQVEPVDVNSSNQRYKDIFTRTGTVPSGEYDICVTAFLAETNEPVSIEFCLSHFVEQISEPILVSPFNESEVDDKLPVFTWTPPVPLPQRIRPTYSIRIAQIYGRQSAYDALRSNPVWFEQSNLPTTVFQYPIAARSFETDKRYAWRITAYDGRSTLGQSEIWEFTKTVPIALAELSLQPKKILVAVLAFKALSVDGGKGHTAAIKPDNTVWSWGNNEFGQLGIGNAASPVNFSPKQSGSITQINAVAAGSQHTLALSEVGMVMSWGNNDFGQLGSGSTDNSNKPNVVPGLSGVQAIAAGNLHSIALKSDGTVWTWGYNRSGELGIRTISDTNKPTRINSFNTVKAIAAGGGHSLALKQDGTVWAWGTNRHGQVAPNELTQAYFTKPEQVEGISNVIAIAAGENFSMALKTDGTVWAWGDNASGQLGNGEFTGEMPDVKKGGSIGRFSIGAIKSKVNNDLKLKESAGTTLQKIELGSLVITSMNGIVKVSALTSVSAIAAGGAHALALRQDSTVWAWGNNYTGALGDGSVENHDAPVRIEGVTQVTQISSGVNHCFALNKSGTVWTWGNNVFGQLGMESAPAEARPGEENIAVAPVMVPYK